ncbi:hypothetical protein MMC13_004876 [Lambiella insularis]|nr:hypothetical protein [Lambiella insularis]
MEARSEKYMRDIAGLFNNTKKYSDARILIGDVILPVHKSVICIQSEYFEKAFQESFVEESSGELRFNDGSGAAHWRVLEYMYIGDYSEDELSDDSASESDMNKRKRRHSCSRVLKWKVQKMQRRAIRTQELTRLHKRISELLEEEVDEFNEYIEMRTSRHGSNSKVCYRYLPGAECVHVLGSRDYTIQSS